MAAIVHGVPVAIPPPEGYVVDFDNPQRHTVTEAYWLFGVGNVFCLLFVYQRAHVRLFIQKRILLEDVCLFIAYVCSVVLQVLIIRNYVRGIIGIHGWEMPLSKYRDFVKALYRLPILYNPVQCGAKLALLLVYRRLAPQLWYRYVVWSVGFVVVGSSVAIFFTTIFPCRPIAAAWDITITEYECIDRPGVYKATAILGAIGDVLVLAVPMPIIIKLHVPRKQKILMISCFGIGAVTVMTSIMRLVKLIRSMSDADQPWGAGPVLVWILVESNLSCICGSLPTLKVFIAHVSPRLLGSDCSKQTYGLSDTNARATIGGSGGERIMRHDQYSRFDDGTPYPLETIINVEAGSHEDSEKQRSDSPYEINGNSGVWEEHGDGSSDKAIYQTRTTTVTYSK